MFSLVCLPVFLFLFYFFFLRVCSVLFCLFFRHLSNHYRRIETNKGLSQNKKNKEAVRVFDTLQIQRNARQTKITICFFALRLQITFTAILSRVQKSNGTEKKNVSSFFSISSRNRQKDSDVFRNFIFVASLNLINQWLKLSNPFN